MPLLIVTWTSCCLISRAPPRPPSATSRPAASVRASKRPTSRAATSAQQLPSLLDSPFVSWSLLVVRVAGRHDQLWRLVKHFSCQIRLYCHNHHSGNDLRRDSPSEPFSGLAPRCTSNVRSIYIGCMPIFTPAEARVCRSRCPAGALQPVFAERIACEREGAGRGLRPARTLTGTCDREKRATTRISSACWSVRRPRSN